MALLNPFPGGATYKREHFKLYLRLPTGVGGELESYVIGRDNDDLSPENSWNEDDFKNVIGEFISNNTLENETLSVEPFRLRTDDKLSDILMSFYINRASGSDIEFKDGFGAVIMEINPTTGNLEPTSTKAYISSCVILYNPPGGSSTEALAMPFTVKLIGIAKPAKFTVATSDFEEATT